MNKTFIVSTGRTGTQFLANFFSENFHNVKSVHEPYPSRHFRVLSNLYSSRSISKKILIIIFKLTRKELFRKTDKNVVQYIESNNFLYGFSGIFDDVLTNYKVIHITRDPRDYIKSHLNHGVFKGKKLLAKKFLPYWFMNVNKRLNLNKNLSEYEILAGRWVLVNEFIEHSCKGNENYMKFKYEDIFGENKNEYLYKMAEFIGLPASKINFKDEYKKMNEGRKNITNTWNNWPNERLQDIYRICGDLMEKYNYKV